MMVVISLVTFSCNDDDTPNFGSVSSGDLDALIVEAQTLLENNPTSTKPGDYQPTAIQMIREALDKAMEIQKYAYKGDQLAYGYERLKHALDKAETMKVQLAMPWIQQENDTYIEISDNIKPVLDGEWTIEVKCYIVDLNTKGYSNNLFSCEQSGPDSGFGVRYFGDGKIQVVVGNNNWTDSGDQAGSGTMKSGEWMDVTMTNNGSHQELFINGAKVAEIDNTHLLAVDRSFVIGNSPMWTDRVCNTLVKDFKLWDSVLDEATIQANRTATFDGSEDGLKCYFPLDADLGSTFNDITGNYTATLKGKIEWVAEPPVIVLDYTKINEAITKIITFKGEVVEGSSDGDYPVGTLTYIDGLIGEANDKKTNETRQAELDKMATKIDDQIKLIKSMLVADATGIFIDRDDPNAVGLRITPNYTPQGDYTVEFDVKVKSLFGYGTGEFFNNGEYGIWVYGYEELTEENVLNSGGLWNFTNAGNGWQGPKTDPLAMKTGEWQHVAIVHDNVARITTLYVDGEEKAVQTDIGAPNVSGWGEMWLGNGWGKMNGYIKDFRLWDVARAAADLNAEIDGTETGLNAYFPLDKVAGVKFADVTGNYQGEMRGIVWNK